jgi:tRNA-Thr(GGU) m(6)t(6)A37 methyltransferase TsaA
MELKQIGVIHSPYQQREDAPRQGRLSDETITIEIFPDFISGLKDIDRLSYMIVLYWGDRSNRDILQSKTPFSNGEMVGVFCSRSPNRPNPIAICVAKLIRQENNLLFVQGVDALDGSPLLDLKVYSPELDAIDYVKFTQNSLHNGNLSKVNEFNDR